MLTLVFVEAALETVPERMWRYASVRQDAKRRGKSPDTILLDRALHHRAMQNLPRSEKRGRPDIVHLCLLNALGTPLNWQGNLCTYVHTVQGKSISVAPTVRLPRNYGRFLGLMEQLFSVKSIPPGKGDLLRMQDLSLEALIRQVSPSLVVALSSHGVRTDLAELCTSLMLHERPLVMLGAYPHGPMEPETIALADHCISICDAVLDAWTVTARLVYQFELTLQRRESVHR